jgi:hypothetical protein
MAGACLVTAGGFIFLEHLDRAASLLGRISGIADTTLGVATAVIFAIERVLEAHGANPLVFLQNFVKQVVISLCPLALVFLGARLSRSWVRTESFARSKKDCECVDQAAGRSTLSRSKSRAEQL